MKITIHFRDDKIEEFKNASESEYYEKMQCLQFYTDEDELNSIYIPVSSIKYWAENDEDSYEGDE